MNAPSPSECYTDYALQEYALGRLAEDVRASVEAHLSTCEACAICLKEINTEIACFHELEANRSPKGQCISEEEIAIFIDGGGEESHRESVISHLNSCQSCTQTLIEIRRETAEALAQTAGILPESPSELGIILTMPPRTAPKQSAATHFTNIELKDSETGT